VAIWQAFLLGMMVILLPSMLIIAILTRRTPVLDESMKPIDEESREMLLRSLPSAGHRQPAAPEAEHRPVAPGRPSR
jgi:hypothetical protein